MTLLCGGDAGSRARSEGHRTPDPDLLYYYSAWLVGWLVCFSQLCEDFKLECTILEKKNEDHNSVTFYLKSKKQKKKLFLTLTSWQKNGTRNI